MRNKANSIPKNIGVIFVGLLFVVFVGSNVVPAYAEVDKQSECAVHRERELFFTGQK
jgi:hypothetical protein